MKDTAMHNLTLAEIARNLAEKRFSAEELTRTLLARIEQLDPQLNSFITTVQTPVKKPGRNAPSRMSASAGSGCTLNSCGSGYRSFSRGANRMSQPASCSWAQSLSQVRG